MVDFSRRTALGAGTALFGALNAALAAAQPAATPRRGGARSSEFLLTACCGACRLVVSRR